MTVPHLSLRIRAPKNLERPPTTFQLGEEFCGLLTPNVDGNKTSGLVYSREITMPRAIPKLANRFPYDRTTPAVRQTKPWMAWMLRRNIATRCRGHAIGRRGGRCRENSGV